MVSLSLVQNTTFEPVTSLLQNLQWVSTYFGTPSSCAATQGPHKLAQDHPPCIMSYYSYTEALTYGPGKMDRFYRIDLNNLLPALMCNSITYDILWHIFPYPVSQGQGRDYVGFISGSPTPSTGPGTRQTLSQCE